MAYALQLDPRNDLANDLPQAYRESDTMKMQFLTNPQKFIYKVESSIDLEHWTDSDVSLSLIAPDGTLTATSPADSEQKFLRLIVETKE